MCITYVRNLDVLVSTSKLPNRMLACYRKYCVTKSTKGKALPELSRIPLFYVNQHHSLYNNSLFRLKNKKSYKNLCEFLMIKPYNIIIRLSNTLIRYCRTVSHLTLQQPNMTFSEVGQHSPVKFNFMQLGMESHRERECRTVDFLSLFPLSL